MQAVILAGGKGTRLNMNIPKAMVKVGDRPVLQYQIELLKKYGITDIVLCVKHLSEKIREHFGDGRRFGVHISYSMEKDFLGTAGAIKFAEKKIKGDFILLFGDVMLNMDFAKLARYHRQKGSMVTLVVHESDHPYDSDIVEIDAKNKVTGFLGKPRPGQKFRNLTNAAVHVMKKSVLKHVGGDNSDFSRDVFPKLIEAGLPIYGYVTSEYIKDMGTPERLERVRRDFESGRILERTAVFLDRDGVINEDVDLVYKTSQLRLIKGSAEGIRMLNQKGFLTIVITNQPVVARNLCTEEEVMQINEKLKRMLARNGARLDGIYYCPHHPDKGYPEENPKYKIECECRKPKIGMIMRASRDFGINPRQCVFVGDRTADIKTGENAGCSTILVKTGKGGADGKYDVRPDYVCKNLLEAAKLILKTHKPR
jgi:mannose-1-phosphate guanylyltransferase/phosphomannomutase